MKERGVPISKHSTDRTAIVIMKATGMFTVAYHDWRAKAASYCTLLNLYAHFRLVDKNHKREVTTQAAGYHYAAHIIQPPVHVPYDLPPTLVPQQPYTLPDISCVSLVNIDNDSFLITPSIFATAVVEATSVREDLIPQAQFTVALVMYGHQGTSPTSNQGSNTTPAPRTAGYGYCHTHGFTKDPTHTSGTYKKQGGDTIRRP